MNEYKSNSEGNQARPERKPDEVSGYYFSSSIKIFDPNSKEVIVHKRGDI